MLDPPVPVPFGKIMKSRLNNLKMEVVLKFLQARILVQKLKTVQDLMNWWIIKFRAIREYRCSKKLDRLGRSTSQVLNLYEELESRGIGLKSLDGIIDTEKRTDLFDKVKFMFMAALAEMERNLIREWTVEGRLAKGIEGKGRRLKARIEEQEQSFLLDVKKHFSLAQLSQKYGISRVTAYRLRKAHKASWEDIMTRLYKMNEKWSAPKSWTNFQPTKGRFFMTKYNRLFKQQIIDFYLQHNKNQSLTLKQFHLKDSTLRRWIAQFNHSGINGLAVLGRKQIYSTEFKLTVIQAVKNG